MENPYVWYFLAAFISTVYYYSIKSYVLFKNPLFIVLTLLLEVLVIYLYYKSLVGNRSSGIVYAIINALSVLLGVMISVFIYKEKMNFTDILGISLIVIGIIIAYKYS